MSKTCSYIVGSLIGGGNQSTRWNKTTDITWSQKVVLSTHRTQNFSGDRHWLDHDNSFRDTSLLISGYKSLTSLSTTKDIFNVEKAWHSAHRLPTSVMVGTVKLYHMKLYPSADHHEQERNSHIPVVIDTDWKRRLQMLAPYCIIRQERVRNTIINSDYVKIVL